MANSNEPEESKDQTLAALHGLDNSEEAADHEEHDGHDEAGDAVEVEPEGREDASVAASGFVGMLAKEGAGGGAGAAGQGSGAPIKANRDEIQMAREIPLAEQPVGIGQERVRTAPKRVVKKVPGWYHAAVPVMYTLGSLLILIGLWAVGALVYMAVKPAGEADVGYWWIAKHMDDDTGAWSYSSGSKLMAIAMLVCLPVSFAMAFMGSMMQKQIRVADRLAGK